MTFLRIEGITKCYQSAKVLKEINLSFNLGEFVAILGPSGCGKSTLLNIIGLIDKPTSGRIYINDICVKSRKSSKYRYDYFGFIYQNYHLIPYYNSFQNIHSSCLFKKIDKEAFTNLLTTLNLVGKEKSYPAELSGGEQQRVAIARALITSPKIILADEPTGALDSKNALQVMNLLKTNSSNRLIIMVTHNEEIALQYATRIIRIEDGSIIEDTSLQAVNSIGYAEPSINYHGLNITESIRHTITSYKKRSKGPLGILIIAALSFFAILLTFGITNGANTYLAYMLQARLDSHYVDIEYYEKEICTNIPEDFYVYLSNNNINYFKTINLDFLMDNYFSSSFTQKDYLDFYFDISIIDFTLLTSNTKSILSPELDNTNAIINKQFYDKTNNQNDIVVDESTYIMNYLIDANWVFPIAGVIDDGGLYNTPKIYLDYNYIKSLFSDEFIQMFFFSQSEIIIPTRLMISSDFNCFYELISSKENIFYKLDPLKAVKEHYFLYDTSTAILRNSLSSLIDSFKLILISATAMIFISTLGLLSLVLTYILKERCQEIAILKSFGASNNDLITISFTESLILMLPGLLLGGVITFVASEVIYEISPKLLNQNWRFHLLSLDGSGIISVVFALVVAAILSTSIAMHNIKRESIKDVLNDV